MRLQVASKSRLTSPRFVSAIFVWSLIFLIALSLRYWFNDSAICFHTDQSRDALVAQKILGGDWQIFGPVVNGRGALFHGVLYYYVIAPLYFLAQGDPWKVNLILTFITTLGLIPTYFVAQKVLGNRQLAFITTALVATAASSIESSSGFWNLVLSIIFLPSFYWACLQLYEKRSVVWGLLTGLTLGLLVQAGLSNIQWVFPLIVVFMNVLNKVIKKDIAVHHFLIPAISSLISFTVTIASMILVEYLAWKRGLFALEESGLHWLTSDHSVFANVWTVLHWAFESIGYLLSPGIATDFISILFVLALSLTSYHFYTENKHAYKPKTNVFSTMYLPWLFFSFLMTPVIAQFLSNSNASYILSGYESIFYILVVAVFSQCVVYGSTIAHKYGGHFVLKHTFTVTIIVIGFFAVSHFAYISSQRSRQDSITCMLQTNYQEKLQAIDFMYQTAAGNPFSFDVTAEPYGINTTYGYLLDWYGKQKYGYTPVFIGQAQAGYPSEGLLPEQNEYLPLHFIVYEPGTYNYWFKQRTHELPATAESQALFYYRQPIIDTLDSTVVFGNSVTVDYYRTDKNPI